MALVSGGDLIEIGYTNSDVGTGIFFGMATEDSTLVLGGGYNNTAMVDGAKRLVVTKSAEIGTFEGVLSNNMAGTPPEFEIAKALQASLNETVWTFGWSNQKSYRGSGVIIDIPSVNANKSTFTLKIASGSGFVQI